MKKIQICGAFLGVFAVGVLSGAFLFSSIQPRPIISVANCSTNCLNSSQIKALLLSAGIQYFPQTLSIVQETDTVLVIKSPEPEAKIDYLVLPKKDIKDLGQLTVDDRKYLDDSFMVIAELIQQNNYTNYQVVINGPDRQRLNYLHVHLLVN